ncbi:YdcF family protein [Methylobacterium sp. BTF04]|uniref:YdcF family protein n=1 Tax=Methylobacterium sp. BTF04 TaxID=2708300 RepID=UPI0013D449F2|nr:YdcF family protein [Methylobacterium sp. BTF04]NEU12204.1 YdcF family protein [Methylobacterium sp. BTF04]
MFFPLSKLIYFVVTPSNFFILIGLFGTALLLLGRRRRSGLTLVAIGALGLFAGGLAPLSAVVALPLEDRFPAFVADGEPVAGIVVLGGAVDTNTSAKRGEFALNDAGERHIAMADLARRYPQARLVFSGGGSTQDGGPNSEAGFVGRFADLLALPRTRLILEDRSRNTHENAAFSADMVKPKPGERWLLVTSAWHMPRAMGCFRQAGFDVTAYPVDYRTAGWSDARRFNGFASEGLLLLDLVTKEWLGLVAYRLAGYTDAWFPAPQASSTAVDGAASR